MLWEQPGGSRLEERRLQGLGGAPPFPSGPTSQSGLLREPHALRCESRETLPPVSSAQENAADVGEWDVGRYDGLARGGGREPWRATRSLGRPLL